MVVWDRCDFAQRRKLKEKSYVVTSDIIYDGVVHEHPRFQIRIERSELDTGGSVGGKVVLRNDDTNESAVIFGVNHWNWDGTALYIFPVYSAGEYNNIVLDKFKELIYPRAHITIIAEDTFNVEVSDSRELESVVTQIPTQFSKNTVQCSLCAEQISVVSLYSHIPKCYKNFCNVVMGCQPLCTCTNCRCQKTHK